MEVLAAQGKTETLEGDIDTRLLKSITGNFKLGKALASITNIEAAALLIRAMWKVVDNSVRCIVFFYLTFSGILVGLEQQEQCL
jgi:hypothetical protein